MVMCDIAEAKILGEVHLKIHNVNERKSIPLKLEYSIPFGELLEFQSELFL